MRRIILKLTYGAELELANVDTRIELPLGNSWDKKDYTIYNSDGSWNDPLKTFNIYGGEINTKVTVSITDAVDNILDILNGFDTDNVVNFSTNLHIHIGIDNWNEETVKLLVDYVWRNQTYIYSLTPLPRDKKLKRRLVSNQYKIPTYIRNRIKEGNIDFGNTRFGINIKSLYTHGTVEFRQFSMTTDPVELYSAFVLCKSIIINALDASRYKPSALGLKLPEHQAQFNLVSTVNNYGRAKRIDILRRIGPISIGFYCLGNVNRSKAAEIIFKQLDTENLFIVSSYGLREGSYGKPLHSQTARLLLAHNYPLVNISTSKPKPKELPQLNIDMRQDIPDPGYTKDGHYAAFIAVEAKCKLLYKELTDEEPKTR